MNEIFGPSLQVIFLSFLSVTPFGKFVIFLCISGVLCVAMMKLITKYVPGL